MKGGKNRGQFGNANNLLAGLWVNGKETLCGGGDGKLQVWNGGSLGS